MPCTYWSAASERWRERYPNATAEDEARIQRMLDGWARGAAGDARA